MTSRKAACEAPWKLTTLGTLRYQEELILASLPPIRALAPRCARCLPLSYAATHGRGTSYGGLTTFPMRPAGASVPTGKFSTP